MRAILVLALAFGVFWVYSRWWAPASLPVSLREMGRGEGEKRGEAVGDKIDKSEDEWRSLLTDEQYRVTRKKGTERAFTGAYWNTKDDGTYQCVCCGQTLFDAKTKFDSGTGWPSYWQPAAPEHVTLETDRGLFMVRTEVLCSRCDAHLGHVFEDGPPPTGLRYCINSASLRFVARE